MSSPTQPMTDPGRAAAKLPVTLVSQLTRDETASTVELARMEPPSAVLEQVLQADEIGQMLRERDREIHFSLSPDNRLLGIELRDSSGEMLRSISPAEAIEIAAGKRVV